MRQLKMIFPLFKKVEKMDIPNGYKIRNCRKGDEEQYISLLNKNINIGEKNGKEYCEAG